MYSGVILVRDERSSVSDADPALRKSRRMAETQPPRTSAMLIKIKINRRDKSHEFAEGLRGRD